MRLTDASWNEWYGHVDTVSQLIATTFATADHLEVLEAGCGSATHLRFPTSARLTGIDISPAQLQRNDRLDVRIEGDLQTYDLGQAAFDVIVCWDVIEHLANPGAALDRLVRALRPDGLLVLGFPNRASLKGMLTRVLPYRAHVWTYRYLFGMRDAGTADKGPFPTPMHRDMDRAEVKARIAPLKVLKEIAYESPMMVEAREKLHLVGAPWQAVRRVLGENRTTTDCIVVARR